MRALLLIVLALLLETPRLGDVGGAVALVAWACSHNSSMTSLSMQSKSLCCAVVPHRDREGQQ